MKANAPEKLYLSDIQRYFDDTDKTISTIKYADDDIEYTRIDSFIEKACFWLKENKDKYLYNTGDKGEYIPTCSGKMIEDFEKYMKG